jgi:hypothetical protein
MTNVCIFTFQRFLYTFPCGFEQVSPATLLEATEPWLGGAQASQELLYIATDESNLAWFDPLKSRHPHLRFLRDFQEETAGLPSDLLGMVEQVRV